MDGVDPAASLDPGVRSLLYDVDPAHLPRALATMTATDLSAVYAQQHRQYLAVVASPYLQPAGDRTVTQPAMEAIACDRPGVEPKLVPGGHNAYVTHPDPIADAMDHAVAAPSATDP